MAGKPVRGPGIPQRPSLRRRRRCDQERERDSPRRRIGVDQGRTNARRPEAEVTPGAREQYDLIAKSSGIDARGVELARGYERQIYQKIREQVR